MGPGRRGGGGGASAAWRWRRIRRDQGRGSGLSRVATPDPATHRRHGVAPRRCGLCRPGSSVTEGEGTASPGYRGGERRGTGGPGRSGCRRRGGGDGRPVRAEVEVAAGIGRGRRRERDRCLGGLAKSVQPAKVVLQSQKQRVHAEESNPAAAGHMKKGECQHQKFKGHLLQNDMLNSSQPTTDFGISNPTGHDIDESMAAFATKKPEEMDITRDALMVLPRGPRSMLCRNRCSHGNDWDGDGTSTSASTHNIGPTTSPEGVTFDAFSELAEFGCIESSPWKTLWKQQPLILHDADLVRASEDIGGQVNLLNNITSVLQNHPGPDIEKGREQLEEWFELLRKKKVEEVVIVNCRWPHALIDFPINDLDCESLRRMRLCFFRISEINLTYAENLTAIDLSGCSISTQELAALVDQTKSLKELDIGLYEGDAIRISSETLEILLIWHSTVRKVSVQNASRLRRVLLAARPVKSSSLVELWIHGAQVLTDVWFNLSAQSIAINNISTMTDNAPLPSLRRLVLNISLLVQKERTTLLNLMKSCTALKELTIWRNDEASDDEAFDAILDDWPVELKNLPCLKLHLEVFTIKYFKGGDSEIAIAAAVLKHAACLQNLTLEADFSYHDDAVFDRTK